MAAEEASAWPAPRATAASRRHRPGFRPAAPAARQGRAPAACSATSRSSRSGVSRQRPSGLRRQVPEPEQGASTSTRSACPTRSPAPPPRAAGRAGGTRSPLRPARRAGQLGSAPAGVAGDDPRRGVGGGQRQRLAARAGAQVDHQLVAGRLAGERDQLAALVLHLDQPVGESLVAGDRAVGRQPQSPRAERRRLGPEMRRHLLAAGAGKIGAKVDRRALDQRRPLFPRGPAATAAAEPASAPRPRLARGSSSARRGRAMPASVEQLGRSAAAPPGRSPAPRPNGAPPEHQLAHRPRSLDPA
jgi:hypothetical protein